MTPPLPLSSTAGLDGRSRILAAARELFVVHGFAVVSMQQIANAAAVNKATLYHHFADKEALFVEVVRQSLAAARVTFDATIAPDAPLPAQLEEIAMLIFSSPPTDLYQLMHDLRDHVSTERREALMAEVAPPWQLITERIAAAQQRGEVRDVDPTLAGRSYFMMVNSLLHAAKLGHSPAPGPAAARQLVDLILHGIANPSRAAVRHQRHAGRRLTRHHRHAGRDLSRHGASD